MKKIKKLKMPLYVILFAAICMSTLSFLNLFTKNPSPLLGYMSWDLGEMTGEDGTEAFDPPHRLPAGLGRGKQRAAPGTPARS